MTPFGQPAPWTTCLAFHPAGEVLLILDGPVGCPALKVARDLELKVVWGESLAAAAWDGAWAQRHMQLALEHLRVEWMVKLDPDVRFARSLLGQPPAEVFGPVQRTLLGPLVYGGCLGHLRSALERVVNSGQLSHPRWQGQGYRRFDADAHPGEASLQGRYRDEDHDLMVLWKLLGLGVAPWTEVQVRFRPAFDPTEINEQYAVWHPVL